MRRTSFNEIQRAFVHRYIDHDGVIGVRIAPVDDQMTLIVDVEDPRAIELPESFAGLRVCVREGGRAVLAYR